MLPPYVAVFLSVLMAAVSSRAWGGHHGTRASNIAAGIRASGEPVAVERPAQRQAGEHEGAGADADPAANAARDARRLPLPRGSTSIAWVGMAVTGFITIMWGLVREGSTNLGPVHRMPGLMLSAGVIGLGWGVLACCFLCLLVRLAFQSFNRYHERRFMVALKRQENESARLLLRELPRLLQDTRRLKLGSEAMEQLLRLTEAVVRPPRNVDYRSDAFELGLTSEEAGQIVLESRERHAAEPFTGQRRRRRVSLPQLRVQARGKPT